MNVKIKTTAVKKDIFVPVNSTEEDMLGKINGVLTGGSEEEISGDVTEWIRVIVERLDVATAGNLASELAVVDQECRCWAALLSCTPPRRGRYPPAARQEP